MSRASRLDATFNVAPDRAFDPRNPPTGLGSLRRTAPTAYGMPSSVVPGGFAWFHGPSGHRLHCWHAAGENPFSLLGSERLADERAYGAQP